MCPCDHPDITIVYLNEKHSHSNTGTSTKTVGWWSPWCPEESLTFGVVWEMVNEMRVDVKNGQFYWCVPRVSFSERYYLLTISVLATTYWIGGNHQDRQHHTNNVGPCRPVFRLGQRVSSSLRFWTSLPFLLSSYFIKCSVTIFPLVQVFLFEKHVVNTFFSSHTHCASYF